MEPQPTNPCLCGLVTDQDLELAEVEFPGICRFYAARKGRDRTFLELLAAFLALCPQPKAA
jgi:hypothetical protein